MILEGLTATLVTTWPVMTEASYLLQSRMGRQDACRFLALYHQGLYEIIDLSATDLQSMVVLMEKYVDLPMDLADALLAVLAEQLGHGRILSTDLRDFQTYRWKNHHPFQNLLLPDN